MDTEKEIKIAADTPVSPVSPVSKTKCMSDKAIVMLVVIVTVVIILFAVYDYFKNKKRLIESEMAYILSQSNQGQYSTSPEGIVASYEVSSISNLFNEKLTEDDLLVLAHGEPAPRSKCRRRTCADTSAGIAGFI